MAERGLRNADLARKLGQKPNNVSRWLTGRTQPGPESLARLATALEVSVDELLGR